MPLGLVWRLLGRKTLPRELEISVSTADTPLNAGQPSTLVLLDTLQTCHEGVIRLE